MKYRIVRILGRCCLQKLAVDSTSLDPWSTWEFIDSEGEVVHKLRYQELFQQLSFSSFAQADAALARILVAERERIALEKAWFEYEVVATHEV